MAREHSNFSPDQTSEPDRIGRRGFLRKAILTRVIAGLRGENLSAKEIKGGEVWKDGYENLRDEVINGKTEASTLFIITKNNKGQWQGFNKGFQTSGGIPPNWLEKNFDFDTKLEVLCHTHPLSAAVGAGYLEQGEAQKMLIDHGYAQFSEPPSPRDIAGAAHRTLLVERTKMGGYHCECVVDPRGLWLFGIENQSNNFIRDLLLQEVKNKFSLDPTFLESFLANHPIGKQVLDSFYKIYNSQRTALIEGKKFSIKDYQNAVSGFIKSCHNIGIRMVRINHEQAKDMKPEDILKNLKIK